MNQIIRPPRHTVGRCRCAVLATTVFCLVGCQDGDGTSGGPPAKAIAISIGVPEEPLGALVIVAAENGYFADEGLDVKIVDTYPSGKRALEGMLEGEVDLTISSEVPLVFQALERDDFRILATIGISDNEPRIVARRDKGIMELSDLRGKNVATQRGSAVHYFLHLVLLRQILSGGDVNLSYLQAEDLPQALADGTIDAFSMREPFVGQAKELMGENAVVFDQPGLYLKTMNLVSLKALADQRPEAVERALRALARAESFVLDRPDDAIRIVSDQLGIDPSQLQAAWQEMEFEVALSQSLMVALDDEARWAIQDGLTDKTEPPDFLKLISTAGIETVKPSAMTIIQ